MAHREPTKEEQLHYDPNGCYAVEKSTGKQCGAGKPPLCGTHERSRSVVRVDEFASGPDEELRRELVDQCDMNGCWAYQLATLSDRANALWQIVTALRPVTLPNGDEWKASRLRRYADDVAKHPEVERVANHPLAKGDCVAVVEDGQYGDKYRCTTSGHGNLLCGVHDEASDPLTIFDSEYDGGPDLKPVCIGDEKHLLLERRDGWMVDPCGDDAIVVTPDYQLDRVPVETLTTAKGLPLEQGDWSMEDEEIPEFEGEARYYSLRHGVSLATRSNNAGNGVDVVAICKSAWGVICSCATHGEAATELRAALNYSVEEIERGLVTEVSTDIFNRVEQKPERPDELARITEGDSIQLRVAGEGYAGAVTDISDGAWDCPDECMHLTIHVESDDIDGRLRINSRRGPYGTWESPTASVRGDAEKEAVDRELGPAIIKNEAMTERDPNPEPEPPESLPKYLREGVPKQGDEALNDLIEFAKAVRDDREDSGSAAGAHPDEVDIDALPESSGEWCRDNDSLGYYGPEGTRVEARFTGSIWKLVATDGDSNQTISTSRTDDWSGPSEELRAVVEAQAPEEVRALFEELREMRADDDDVPGGKGTLTRKTIDERDYWYLQWREGGDVVSQYVGPVSPKGQDR